MKKILILLLLIGLTGCTKKYKAKDFDINIITSSIDGNQNGIDDYTDILNGAKAEAKRHPHYDGAYVEGGYPDESIGVCCDVVWRAFRDAGYNLKNMIDLDYSRYPQDYIDYGDSNIGFRRVTNLHVFFGKYAISLSTNIEDIDTFMPGDIVIFKNDKHIGIISDYRNKDGIPYLIHNAGQRHFEEDALEEYEIIGHYRFDVSQINSSIIQYW